MNTVPAAVKVVRMPLSLLQLVGKLQLHCLQLKLAVWRSLITQKTCSSAINSCRADGLSLFVSTKNNLNYFITYAYIYIYIININPATPSKPVGCSRPLRRNLISLKKQDEQIGRIKGSVGLRGCVVHMNQYMLKGYGQNAPPKDC